MMARPDTEGNAVAPGGNEAKPARRWCFDPFRHERTVPAPLRAVNASRRQKASFWKTRAKIWKNAECAGCLSNATVCVVTSTQRMQSRIVFTGQGKVALMEAPSEPLAEGTVRLRSLYSLLSTGTETICFTGNYEPGTGWDGWVKYPFHPGYALVGEVVELGPGATSLRVGQVVASRCGHASDHVKPESECYPVPSGMDPKLMTWFALAKIAAMGARAAAHRLGESVVVVGAGPVGQMAVRWAAATGPEHLVVVDTVEKRLEMALHGGATLGIAKPIDDAQCDITAALGGRQPDLVIDTTGNPLAFRGALRTARLRGRVLLLGDTGHPDEQHMVQELVLRGLTLVGAHDGNEDEQWNTPRILRLFFRLVRDGLFPLDGLITHEFLPGQCGEAYALAANRRAETMGILFDWRAQS